MRFESNKSIVSLFSLVLMIGIVCWLGFSMLEAESAEVDMTGKKIAVMIGPGFHDGEAVFPMGYLVNRGAEMTVIGIETGLIKAYNSDLRMNVERSVAEVSPEEFDALIIPGGMGPSELRKDETAVDFARRFFKTGKPVAGICHGPQVLVDADVLKGRVVTGVGSIKGEIEECGADYQDSEVVVDGHLITSRNPGDLPAFSKAIAKAVGD